MTKQKQSLIASFLIGFAILVGLDQWTKGLAVKHLMHQPPFVIWDGVFELLYSENRGAAFGMMQGMLGQRRQLIGLVFLDNRFCTCGVGFDAFVSLKFADSGKRGLLTYLENPLHESLTYQPETYEIENSTGTVRYKAFLIACANASQYGNNAYIAPQASLTDGMMDITVLEPFTMLDVPSLSFQLFNRTLDQNSRIKTMKDKSIIIHRAKEGVFHFDGDPMMGGKDLKVEIIHHGLHVIAPIRPKQMPSPPLNILQHFTDFIGRRPITSAIAQKHKQLLMLNHHILRRLSKK